MVTTKTLTKIAVFGGIVTAATGLLVVKQIESTIKKTPYFVEALKVFHEHPGATSLLGEPIKVGRVDMGDTSKNRCDLSSAKFEVPVKGPKDKGTLYLEAKREVDQDKWQVTRLALKVDSVTDRELLISSTGG